MRGRDTRETVEIKTNELPDKRKNKNQQNKKHIRESALICCRILNINKTKDLVSVDCR